MLGDEYRSLGITLEEALPPLGVRAMVLPPIQDSGIHGDCFGFIVLSDSSVGPFYISLGDAHERLTRRYPAGGLPQGSIRDLLDGFVSEDDLARAIALGTFNALSQSLMRRSGFIPANVPARADPESGETIGMVGFFGRLARRWSAAGARVKVLELSPQRLSELPGISLVRDASELGACQRIICTSSVLINQTLDPLLDAIGDPSAVELTGPSGSGLPDIPLARGIRSVGGAFFTGSDELITERYATARWSGAGRRFELRKDNYPGVDTLLRKLPGFD